ncbi:MAG TPA: NAD(P)/FAD-dependent oxidoreductase [Anaerolineaceae bacterium]
MENKTDAGMKRVVIVGAGIGGLTTAAVLARAGLDVTVLEAEVYPGGCASTYFHQGYHFDAGATLSTGFYPGGPMDLVAQSAGITSWPAHPSDIAMVVHLPDGSKIPRWSSESRWEEYRTAFGNQSMDFFRWQEQTALWALALRQPNWPPQSLKDSLATLEAGLPWLLDQGHRSFPNIPGLIQDALRLVAAHLHGASEKLKLFLDAQLLISAQATSERANALNGAAALDLPRRGVVHLAGGIGVIAETLVEAVRRHSGRVLYRHAVTRIRTEHGLPVSVETKPGDSFPTDLIIANLPPWNTAELFDDDSQTASLRSLPDDPDGWGAFMVYVGLDDAIVPSSLSLHHQIVVRRPLGEGNTIFALLSPAWDTVRAPCGQRALTLSTHTSLQPGWQLYDHNRIGYSARRAEYTERILAGAELALPGLRDGARLILPGTPHPRNVSTLHPAQAGLGGWISTDQPCAIF